MGRFHRSGVVASALFAWTAASLAPACDQSNLPAVALSPQDSGIPDAPSRDSAPGDGGPVDGGGDDVIDAGAPDAPLVPVRVGICPTQSVSDDAGATSIDEAQGVLDAIAVGSRGVTVVRRWDQLFGAGLQPDPDEWSRLASTSKLVAQSKRRLLFSVAIVDRTLDARPAGLGAWSSPATLSAADALVDKVFATFGDELQYLGVGVEVDRFMTAASPAERSAFAALATHMVDHARAQSQKPADVRVGVVATLDSIVADKPPGLLDLVRYGDVALTSYFPMDTGATARPPSVAPADLDAVAAALRTDAAPQPEVVLAQVGYPSDPAAAGSDAKQRAFFDGLFQALLTRRGTFPFVAVKQLDDAPDTVCANDALAMGMPGNAAAVAFACSLGLRRRDATLKPAFARVIDGLATFASP